MKRIHAHASHCQRCTKCCNYICIEVDSPTCRADFNDYTWILAHRGVTLRIEKKAWYMLVKTPCRYLKNGHCKIYDERPHICRRYEPGNCDFDSRPGHDDDADHVFRTLEQLHAWRDEHFPRRKKRASKKKTRRKGK